MRSRTEETRRDEFAEAARAFARWRARRVRGERIPEELWRSAVALADKHGVSPTATRLKLDYYSVKRRLAAGPGGSVGRGSGPPGLSGESAGDRFVEVSLAAPSSRLSCVLDLEASGGRPRLRLELQGIHAAELQALVHSLWGPPA